MKKYTQLIIWGVVVALVVILAVLASGDKEESVVESTEVDLAEEVIEDIEEEGVVEDIEIKVTEDVEVEAPEVEKDLSRRELRKLTKKEAAEEEEALLQEETTIEVAEVEEEVAVIESAETAEVAAQSAITPVVENGYVYSFEAIDWEFEEVGDSTKLGLRFRNFSRREGGSPATFARPYGVGTYSGTCAAAIAAPAAPGFGELLSASVCGDVTIAAFQNETVKTLIDVKAYQNQAWSAVRTLDLSTLIK